MNAAMTPVPERLPTRMTELLAEAKLQKVINRPIQYTPDGNPLIGPHPTRRGVWLALGHEGLGVTTAPATAELLAAQILGERCPLAPEAWLPTRLYHQEAIA